MKLLKLQYFWVPIKFKNFPLCASQSLRVISLFLFYHNLVFLVIATPPALDISNCSIARNAKWKKPPKRFFPLPSIFKTHPKISLRKGLRSLLGFPYGYCQNFLKQKRPTNILGPNSRKFQASCNGFFWEATNILRMEKGNKQRKFYKNEAQPAKRLRAEIRPLHF